MKFCRNDRDLVSIRVFYVIYVLLQLLYAHKSHLLVPLVAALEIIRQEMDLRLAGYKQPLAQSNATMDYTKLSKSPI